MKPVRVMLLGLIVALIGFVGVQLYQSFQIQREREIDSEGTLDMLPQAVQMIQNFHRVEIRDGEKVWELKAEEAQYLPESDEVVVRNLRASFFRDDGGEVVITGGKGHVRLVDRELRRIRVRDNVVVHVEEFVIKVDDATYSRDLDRIVARGPVHIVGDTLELRGRGMNIDVERSSFTIDTSVHMTIRPSLDSDASDS
jgi:LPS export ABC transporter protein LptC